jgi:hypothetical protein
VNKIEDEYESISKMRWVSETAPRILKSLMLGDRDTTENRAEQAMKATLHLWRLMEEEFPPEKEAEEEVERTNENGDTILYITPGTAPCSEIGDALHADGRGSLGGQKAFAVARLARSYSIQPAGTVVWSLAAGETSEAKTYDLRGWRELVDAAKRKGLIPYHSNPTPPLRLQGKDIG